MDNKMIKGAKIATIGLFVTKILGILYVIPMNALLSTEAMGIYGISYVQYAFFIQITLVGFPVGVSKIVAKYRAEHNFTMVNKTFKYSVVLVSIFGIVAFLIMFFGADTIVKFMRVGVYNPKDVAITLKLLAPSLLVIPVLAISRGYTQGYEDMLPSSISMVVEQFIRILFIIIGLVFVIKVFKADDIYAIYIATIASFFSAFFGYLILTPSFKRYFSFAKRNSSKKDYKISFKNLIRVVAIVSVPFIVLSTYKGLFEYIDSVTINRILDPFAVSKTYIKQIISIYSVQIQKLVILTLTIASGFTLSMIPSLSALHSSRNYGELKKRITQITLLAFFIICYVSLFVAIFADETYFVFFFSGYKEIGGQILSLSIISSIFYATYNVIGVTLLTLNHIKVVIISFIAGIISKLIFTYIFAYIFSKTGQEPALIFAASSFVAYVISFYIVLKHCISVNLINVTKLIRVVFKIAISSILLIITTKILSLLLPAINDGDSGFKTYLINIAVLISSGIITLFVYLFSAQKMNYLRYLSGKTFKELLLMVKNRATR
ncbi:MAG: oligosaccharide flippase family protein [Bacilli bacterium]